MNLAHHYPILYWQTACLSVNASADEESDDNKSTNYGRVAKAIGDIQQDGAVVALPDINQAYFEFKPDLKSERIIFGLRGIVGLGDEAVSAIIQNRPYASLLDFLEKNGTLPSRAIINLIKAGAFLDIDNENRTLTMRDYIVWLTKKSVEPKAALNLRNMDAAILLGILPPKFDFQQRLYNYRSYAFSPEFASKSIISNEKGKALNNCYDLSYASRIFFEHECLPFLTENKDYWFVDSDIVVYKNRFDKWYDKQMVELKVWLTTPEALQTFNTAQYNAFANETWEKYCKGTVPRWEMDSLSFYYTDHELSPVNIVKYDITNYQDIPEDPIVVDTIQKINKATGEVTSEWDKYQLFKIVGTVLDKNANGHYITLLTPNGGGVVTVKFYDGAFAHYNKQVSKVLPGEDKKTVIEKSWFTRGTKLLITGIRRGETFYPKRYYDSMYQHTVCLIEEVYDSGSMKLKYERERAD